ncbi:MAG: helix-turn-helix transcriptional regulator [Planctomycetes bacterium]|nr:helix-turn-helix transcriptional regulator [Planctomycetota bacterium]
MNTTEPLIRIARKANVINAYQYVNTDCREASIPHSIRIFLRDRPASSLGKTIHNQHTMVINLQTPGKALIDREQVLLNPGQALLIFPGQLHDYANVKQENIYWLFIGFLLDSNTEYLPLLNNPVTFSEEISRDLQSIISSYYRSFDVKAPKTKDEMQIAMRLKLILEQLLQIRIAQLISLGNSEAGKYTNGTAFPMIQKTCDFISKHLSSSLSIEMIASAIHVSPGHLRNEFQRRLGCSLGKYIRYMKMHNACILMDTTELPIAEIGLRCGYGSIYAFSRAFKKEKGISPSEYRSTYCPVK